jgi:large subunit ribosomal protein L24e
MKCSFCGSALNPGSGKMFVKNDGTIFYYCSSKCEKNMRMGRDPKKRKWSRKK